MMRREGSLTETTALSACLCPTQQKPSNECMSSGPRVSGGSSCLQLGGSGSPGENSWQQRDNDLLGANRQIYNISPLHEIGEGGPDRRSALERLLFVSSLDSRADARVQTCLSRTLHDSQLPYERSLSRGLGSRPTRARRDTLELL